jgi:hypothetical protein
MPNLDPKLKPNNLYIYSLASPASLILNVVIATHAVMMEQLDIPHS